MRKKTIHQQSKHPNSGLTASLESRESASPVITRAVAAALQNRPFNVYEFPIWQKIALTVMSFFPTAIIRRAVEWDTARNALDALLTDKLQIEQLVDERLADYEGLPGPFDAVVVGAALGGAAAHLSVALGAPFLPQPFILGFRGGSPDDDVARHCANALKLVEPILKNNPDVLAISHFDPVHDGWLTRMINHVRIKLLDIPDGYRHFIRNRLSPGGTIVYLDCQAHWIQYHLGPRHRYQVGGWGGITAEEFLTGSDRIDNALSTAGSKHRGGWRLDGFRAEEKPESEWGSEPGLDGALQRFADREGFRFLRIRLPHPHDYSRLAFMAQKELCRRSKIEAQGVIVETFTQYGPTEVVQGGLLPLWLIFNTTDSLAFLKSNLDAFPADRPIFFSGLATFSRTPDMVPWEEWAEAFGNRYWINIGASCRRYPEDLLALWRWPNKLRAWTRAHTTRVTSNMQPDEMLRLATKL